MWLEDPDHIIVIEHDHEAGHSEEEPSHSHPEVDQDSWSFVLLVHVFFVVDVVCGHLEDQGVVGCSPAETIEPL